MHDTIGKYKNKQCSDLRLGFNWQVNNEIRIEKTSCGFRKHYKNNKCVNTETVVISSLNMVSKYMLKIILFSASSSFSFFFSHTHTPSFLAPLLSPCLNPRQPPLNPRCIVVTLLSHTRCTTLAATPSLRHPRCLTFVVPHSLPHPRCLTLAAPSCSNLSSPHPSHCWL